MSIEFALLDLEKNEYVPFPDGTVYHGSVDIMRSLLRTLGVEEEYEKQWRYRIEKFQTNKGLIGHLAHAEKPVEKKKNPILMMKAEDFTMSVPDQRPDEYGILTGNTLSRLVAEMLDSSALSLRLFNEPPDTTS